MTPPILAWMPGPIELVVIGGVALLVFGRRLPEVARSLGRSIVEFKRGIRDVKDEVEVRSNLESDASPRLEQRDSEKPHAPSPEGTKGRSAGTSDAAS